MRNENVHMQTLHRQKDVVLVQILRYNCSETDYSFCEDLLPSRTPPSTRMRVSPSDLFSPSPIIFFAPLPLLLGDATVRLRQRSLLSFVGRSVLSFVSAIR